MHSWVQTGTGTRIGKRRCLSQQREITGMRQIAGRCSKAAVEFCFGIRERSTREVHAFPFETWRSQGNQKTLWRLIADFERG